MKSARVILAVFSISLVLLWLLPDSSSAQDVNRAALIVRESDQAVHAECIEFSESEISGLDLLQRSALDLQIDVQSMGAKVCSIEQTGCPSDDCWCQCKGGGDCVYWSYWHHLNGQWSYSQGGASMYSVGDGDVEGWSWGPGAVNQAIPPPAISFEDVCVTNQADEPTITPSPTQEPVIFMPEDTPTAVPAQRQPVVTMTSTTAPSATSPATATALPTSTPLPVSTATIALTAETVPSSQADPSNQSTVVPEATAVIALDEAEMPPNSPATSQPLPKPSPTPEVLQSMPQASAAAVLAVAPVEVRPVQKDTKSIMEQRIEPKRDLPVIGDSYEMGNLAQTQINAAAKNVGNENSTPSLLPYAIFCLIVLGLSVLWLLTSVRRKTRQN